MKSLIIIVCCLALALILGAVAIGASSYVGAANYGNRTEVVLKGKLDDNQNILAQYGLRLAEIAQVPGMAREDMIAVAKAAIGSRMGPEGSKATWQWIKEQNPNVDPQMYRKVQQTIEEGRNRFERAQTEMVDMRVVYETQLGNIWSGFWLKMAGYPKIDLSKYVPISTGRAKQAFETGIEEPIILGK